MSTETTYCYCWLIVRKDNERFAFTDHDRKLTLLSDEYTPVDGILTTQIRTTLDLNNDDLEVEGALSDDSISNDDLEAGLFDGASISIYMVNWETPAIDHKLLVTGKFGDFNSGEYGFTTEINSLVHELEKVQGDVYQRNCSADLGDSRCGVDLTSSTHRAITTIAATDEVVIDCDDLSAYDDDWFTLGRVVTAGGATYQIRAHTGDRVELWEVPLPALAVGQSITVIAGCKKDDETCHSKFNNLINFRGHGVFMPGQDALASYPVRGKEDYDGGSLFN